MGSDTTLVKRFMSISVSIHAPTWGATKAMAIPIVNFGFNPRSHMGSDQRNASLSVSFYMFQSTLPHGERRALALRQAEFLQFQSTLPHGERPARREGEGCPSAVSIHAPTWGATAATYDDCNAEQFQSTLPHGERHLASTLASSASCFNPRSHMGSDYTLRHKLSLILVSIHAPTWGATSGAWQSF